MRLPEILKESDFTALIGEYDRAVKMLAYNSMDIVEEGMFFAIPGIRTDGHKFIEDAISRGAKIIVHEKDFPYVQGLTFVRVADSRRALAKAAVNFYLHPSKKMLMVGVTGTDGKTSTARITHAILSRYGQTGLLGTIGHLIGGKQIKASRTTPESIDLNQYLAEMVKTGSYAAVMEVSSHAISLRRIDNLAFDAAVFTNLSQDHLDFHKSMDDYFDAKAELFTGLAKDSVAVINLDDDYGRKLREISTGKVIGYSFEDKKAEVYAELISSGVGGIRMNVYYMDDLIDLQSPLFGKPSAYNILASVSTALTTNCGISGIKAAIREFTGIKGRFEGIDCGEFIAVIDYAHTPKAVENVCKVLRNIASSKLIVVLGCGGDRDKSKRPLMAAAAEQFADKTYLTSDNPRTEDPLEIIKDMTPGLKHPANAEIVPERRLAIRLALDNAGPQDIIAVLGKGHEDYQEINEVFHHFDDGEIVSEWIQEQSKK